MISVHQMGEVLGKVSGCSCTQLAEFYLQKQVLASGDVASGCRVKRVAPMTVTRIFLLKNVRVNGDWRYLSKIAMVPI